MSLGMFLLLAPSSTSLSVETDSPDALCPPLAVTRAAVAARLGTLTAPQGWTARYTVGHAPDQTTGDFVRLQVFDPGGHLRMERDLPMGNGSCAELAPGIALLLDYFFRNLNNPEGIQQATTQDSAEAATAKQQAPIEKQQAPIAKQESHLTRKAPATEAPPVLSVVLSPKLESTETPLATQNNRRSWWVGMGLGRTSFTHSTGLWFEGNRSFGGVAVGLNMILPLGRDSETVGNSRLLSWTSAVRTHLGLLMEERYISAFLGPELFLGFDHVTPQGLQRQSAQWRLVPGLGLSGNATIWALPQFGIVLSAGLDWTPSKLTNRLLVWTDQATAEVEVHRPPSVRGFVGLGVAFRTNP